MRIITKDGKVTIDFEGDLIVTSRADCIKSVSDNSVDVFITQGVFIGSAKYKSKFSKLLDILKGSIKRI